jgi:hypothetical protein
MYYDVTDARYIEDYKLELTFDNGKSGMGDFRKYIQERGVFAKLENLDYFKGLMINRELGVISWGEEVDVAPETLYAEATEEPLPGWMPEARDIKKTARISGHLG